MSDKTIANMITQYSQGSQQLGLAIKFENEIRKDPPTYVEVA